MVGQLALLLGSGRYGILSLVIFFIGGILLLSRVDIEAGRRAAQREDAELQPVSVASG